jgi:hypothetical protein
MNAKIRAPERLLRALPIERALALYLAIVAWAVWMGGFAFYFGVVVPVGGRLIGGSEQGFITQQVTHWLNLISVGVLAILLGHSLIAGSRLMLGTWGIMVAFQFVLFVMHAELDGMIDGPTRAVAETGRFHRWHEAYEFLAAAQWLAAMVHLGGIIRQPR